MRQGVNPPVQHARWAGPRVAIEKKYLGPIRDGNSLFLHLRITRHFSGDVYVITVSAGPEEHLAAGSGAEVV